jgi:hypothetical protein
MSYGTPPSAPSGDLAALARLLLDRGEKMAETHDLGIGRLLVSRSQSAEWTHLVPRVRHKFTFADPSSLAAWLRKHGDANGCQILVDKAEVAAVLDPHDAGSHRANATLTHHPVWGRWAAVLGRALRQKQLHTLLRAARADLGPLGETLLLRVGSMSASDTATYQQTIDARGMTTLQSADRTTTLSADIPPEIVITVPMYVGVLVRAGDAGELLEPHYTMTLLVEVSVVDGKPFFTLTCPDLEVVELRARQDVATSIRQQLDERPWLVGLGSIESTTWVEPGTPTGQPHLRGVWRPDEALRALEDHAPRPAGGPVDVEPEPAPAPEPGDAPPAA